MAIRDQLIKELATNIQRDGCVNITAFFSEEQNKALCEQAEKACEHYAKRKDFVSIHGGNTPRIMFTVGKDNLDLSSNLFNEFYNDPEVLALITRIGGQRAILIPYDKEKYVGNYLCNNGDTHGWHFDDYSYALVLIVRAPPINCGGMLEFVPNNDTKELLEERATFNGIDSILEQRTINSKWFPSGSIYLMKSLTTLHRVSPIKEGHSRISIAFSYGIESDIVKGHGNIEDLYD